jgi:outer membrane protein with beta-barrel domain
VATLSLCPVEDDAVSGVRVADISCMRPNLRISVLFAALLCGASGPAWAQTNPSQSPWTHGTTVNVFAGTASASSDTGPLAGMALGWEVTRWVTVEGTGSWLNRRQGAEAFAADLKALVNVMPTRSILPFIQGGVGLYRASFDPSRDAMPAFYRNRFGTRAFAASAATFTDPTFVVGGGVNMFVSRHLAIRPDFQTTIVSRDADHYIVNSASVHLAYHFEPHPTKSEP